MPQYSYIHPETGEIIDIQQRMSDEHTYIDENGVKWDRVFYPTNFAFDTKIDPHDPKAFVRKTEKSGTLGSIMDLSREMSERRGGDKNDEVKMDYQKAKNKKLDERTKANQREDLKKKFEEFKKLDKPKIKPLKKNRGAKKNS